MSNVILKAELMEQLKRLPNNYDIESRYREYGKRQEGVIAVLDDDPTGIQTVHGVDVYYGWSKDMLKDAFAKSHMFFVSTNTRSFDPDKTEDINSEIMSNLITVSEETGKDFVVISRGDSTLRGHYPLETDVLRKVYEKHTGKKIDGEIIIPFFEEGGRFTYNDTHYVQQGEQLIPVGETEFARDKDFAYKSSDLKYYIEEKTQGRYPHNQVISIPLDMLRSKKTEEVKNILSRVENFDKVIVNALSYNDLKVFVLGLLEAEKSGKRFIFRTAASFVKVYGFIKDKKLLGRKDFESLLHGSNKNVLFVVGSYVKRTAEQLRALLDCEGTKGIELNVERVIESEKSRQKEINERVKEADNTLKLGESPVLYTSSTLRGRVEAPGKDSLLISRLISKSLVEIVRGISVEPSCIVAKGGITSSDVATKGLGIVKARVLGQILPGVPVIIPYKNGVKFSNPYIVFPGNVGDRDALVKVFKTLTE